MQTNTLAPKTPRITSPRVGRGSTRGKTSGRGTKGQNARAGHKKRPEFRDLIKKMPKRRGHGKNRARTVRPRDTYIAINLSALDANFSAGDAVTPIALLQKGLLGSRGGYLKQVKILGTGSLTKALTISGCEFSGTAKEAIEAAGGKISYAG
ncbi:MAG TPA: uL15m family ribosomal protein [Candidatus Paceibacterota bacterium]|jgi:large subunit ribosomal protein L15|nr:uL15m family ribosomal protein [Candidatus Paceibacterota bacterium]